MTGIHQLTVRVPFEVMEAVWAKVERRGINAYVVALIRKDLAMSSSRNGKKQKGAR